MLSVKNNPRFTSSQTANAQAGMPFTYAIKYENPLGGSVSIVFLTKPAWATTSPVQVTGTPVNAGIDSLVMVLKVDNVAYDTLTVRITIQPAAFVVQPGKTLDIRQDIAGLVVFTITGRIYSRHGDIPSVFHKSHGTGVFVVRQKGVIPTYARRVVLTR